MGRKEMRCTMNTMITAERIKEVSLAEVFQVPRLEELEWVFFHREMFPIVVQTADPSLHVREVEDFLRLMSDSDFMELIAPTLEREGFLAIENSRFSKLVPDHKKTSDRGFIYINRHFLMKRMIGFAGRFDWTLKAMALDLKSFREESLVDIFKENFEENGRLLEELAVGGTVAMEDWLWTLDPDTETLIGKYKGRVVAKWSHREVLHAFTYRTKERDVE